MQCRARVPQLKCMHDVKEQHVLLPCCYLMSSYGFLRMTVHAALAPYRPLYVCLILSDSNPSSSLIQQSILITLILRTNAKRCRCCCLLALNPTELIHLFLCEARASACIYS